jgi:hypothetical protein
MGKQRYRRRVARLEARIREHRAKIRREEQKSTPDEGLIRHWETEIKAFEGGIQRARKGLRETE